MPSRPTREFKTSGGHTLVLNEYITGAENWNIRDIYIRARKSEDTDGPTTDRLAEGEAFKAVIVSLDNSTEDIVQRVFSLPLPDYQEVVAAVTPIVEGKKKPETS